VTWAYSRLLVQQTESRASLEAVAFMQSAGVMGVELAAYRNRPPHRFARQVHSIPACFRPILPDETLTFGGRQWRVIYGNGHAPELVTLWNSEWAIVSDQLLPSVGASLVVPYTEPHSDVVGEWLGSLDEISRWVSNDVICLPGHQLPFQGAAVRCQQNRYNIETLCQRLLEHLRVPQTAYACLSAVYRRDLSFDERLFFVTEVIGLLNHLKRSGKVSATVGPGGATLWKSNTSRGS
jgi:glyoxylase-like metal-dependent hydrolase (beta-lactamase superfamily II)